MKFPYILVIIPVLYIYIAVRKFIENLELYRYLDPEVKARLGTSAQSGMVKVATSTSTGADGSTTSKRSVSLGLIVDLRSATFIQVFSAFFLRVLDV